MATTAPRTMTSTDRRGDRRALAAGPAFLAAATEFAVAVVVFTAATVSPAEGPLPLIVPMACLAIVVSLQLGVAFGLRQKGERPHRLGTLGAAALALIGILVTATLVVAIGMLLAISVIDLAFGLPSGNFGGALAELGLAEYVSVGGMVIAIPVVGWLTFLNARSALLALDATTGKPSGLAS